MKKSLKALSVLAVAGVALAPVAPVLAQEGTINVVSREDGSGTRGAFVEIVGVIDDNEDDLTTQTAVIQNSTNGVMQTVAGDPQGIGYISLGSLDDSVKAVKVDGVEATPENVANEEFPISRPFNLAWNADEGLSDAAQDFLNYINSSEGQAIIEEEGYIKVDEEAAAYEAAEVEGTVEVVGSTSVAPVIEKLAEEYQAVNDKVTINVTANGSSAGMSAAQDGTADLGMASRALDEEEAANLESQAIALDGIAVIVNKENPAEDLSLDAIRGIFLGEITEWEEAVK